MTNKLIKNAKDTIKLGGLSMAGGAALGALGSMPGMPSQAKGVSNVAMSGLMLANVGQLGRTGMGLASSMGGAGHRRSMRRRMGKHRHGGVVGNILGRI